MAARSELSEVKIEAAGTSTPPAGMTREEADRLAREADLQRNPPNKEND